MRKNLYIWAAFMAMIVVLSACGTGGSSQNASQSGGSAPKTEQKKGNQKVSDHTFPQLSTAVADNEKLIEMDTSMGTIKIKLFPEYAPKAVENFVKHSQDGYYNGLIFHRVIKGFMIQGGDPNGNGTGGESIWGHPFEDEFSDKLYNIRGALTMANSGANTNGSQFFIVQNNKLDPAMKQKIEQMGYPKEVMDAYETEGGTPWLDQQYTVFGQVISGMDVVDKIAEVPTDAKDKPKENISIKSVKVLK